jgi:hypothetical protein
MAGDDPKIRNAKQRREHLLAALFYPFGLGLIRQQ